MTDLKPTLLNIQTILRSQGKRLWRFALKLSLVPEKIADEVRTDIAAVRQRDPAAKSDMEVLLLSSGVHAILAYRVAHKLYVSRHYFPARMISQVARLLTGIEIHPGATIGKGFFIDHGMVVVIGETTEIGDNCSIYQGVTLGGTGKDIGKRHPTLENDVMVSAGAKILGPLTIGTGSKIGAGSVVLKSVPPHSTVVGVPGRIVKQAGKRVADMDQVKLPDPILEELKRLNDRIYELERNAGIKTCRYSLTIDEDNMRPENGTDCDSDK